MQTFTLFANNTIFLHCEVDTKPIETDSYKDFHFKVKGQRKKYMKHSDALAAVQKLGQKRLLSRVGKDGERSAGELYFEKMSLEKERNLSLQSKMFLNRGVHLTFKNFGDENDMKDFGSSGITDLVESESDSSFDTTDEEEDGDGNVSNDSSQQERNSEKNSYVWSDSDDDDSDTESHAEEKGPKVDTSSIQVQGQNEERKEGLDLHQVDEESLSSESSKFENQQSMPSIISDKSIAIKEIDADETTSPKFKPSPLDQQSTDKDTVQATRDLSTYESSVSKKNMDVAEHSKTEKVQVEDIPEGNMKEDHKEAEDIKDEASMTPMKSPLSNSLAEELNHSQNDSKLAVCHVETNCSEDSMQELEDDAIANDEEKEYCKQELDIRSDASKISGELSTPGIEEKKSCPNNATTSEGQSREVNSSRNDSRESRYEQSDKNKESTGAKMDTKQLSNLRSVLFEALNIEITEDASDLVDYTITMVENGKSIRYIVDELVTLQMEICDDAMAHKIGEKVASFCVEGSAVDQNPIKSENNGYVWSDSEGDSDDDTALSESDRSYEHPRALSSNYDALDEFSPAFDQESKPPLDQTSYRSDDSSLASSMHEEVTESLEEDVKSNLSLLAKLFPDMEKKESSQLSLHAENVKKKARKGWDSSGLMQRYDPTAVSARTFEVTEKDLFNDESKEEIIQPNANDEEEMNVSPKTSDLEERMNDESDKDLAGKKAADNMDENQTTTGIVNGEETQRESSTKELIEEKGINSSKASQTEHKSNDDVYEEKKLESVFAQTRTGGGKADFKFNTLFGNNKDLDTNSNVSSSGTGGFSFSFDTPTPSEKKEFLVENERETTLPSSTNAPDSILQEEPIDQTMTNSHKSQTLPSSNQESGLEKRKGFHFARKSLMDIETNFFSMNEGIQNVMTRLIGSTTSESYYEKDQAKWHEERRSLTLDFKRKHKQSKERNKKRIRYK